MTEPYLIAHVVRGSPASVMHGDGQPANMPFERVPQHEADPGFGPVPTKPKVTELFPKPQIPNEK